MMAQKIVKKTVIGAAVTLVQIDAKNCFDINLQTSDSDEIQVEAIIDGEYKNDLMLNVRQEGSSILVSTGFTPNFMNPNDKLSAHKVISIALLIKLPQYQNVYINGTNCNVTASGKYENLKITLSDGNCNLSQVSEAVTILTQSGDITIHSTSAEIKAHSKFGNVQRNDIPIGNNRFILTTTTGNIYLNNNE